VKVLFLLVAAFFAVLSIRLMVLGGWINFAGALFLGAICWRLCTLSGRIE
jgi:hypothetical protein